MVRTKILHDLLQKVLLLDNYSAKRKKEIGSQVMLWLHQFHTFFLHYLTISLAKYSPMTSILVFWKDQSSFFTIWESKAASGTPLS